MSGAAGMRGYLLQALVCLLDALSADSDWNDFSLEPDSTSEKVDLFWRYPERTRVVQVKSSQNQITKPMAERWASDLENAVHADEYQLLLIGPCSQSVVELGQVGSVTIPTPKVLDISALVEQAAHRLDRYLDDHNVSKVPAFARELLVNALVTKLETYSTSGACISRADFEKVFIDWILVLYPRSLSDAVSMQCDVLLDTVVFPTPSADSHDSLAIVLPLTFLNTGVRTAIVEWVALKVVAEDHKKLYTPVAIIDLQKLIQGARKLHAESTLGPFVEFAIPHDNAVSTSVLLTQEENDGQYPFRSWNAGKHTFQLFVKYRDKESALLQREIEIDISDKMLADYKSGTSIVNSIREIVI